MKSVKKLLAIMLVLAMSVCIFAACGDDAKPAEKEDTKKEDTNKEETKEESKEDSKEDSMEDDKEETTEPENSVDAEKVAAYVESNRSSYEESSTNDAGVGILEARGTSIVCGYKYTIEIPAEAKSQLEILMDSEEMSAQFEGFYEQIKAEEPAVSSVIIEYYDMNGSLLYSKEIK